MYVEISLTCKLSYNTLIGLMSASSGSSQPSCISTRDLSLELILSPLTTVISHTVMGDVSSLGEQGMVPVPPLWN